MERWKSYLTAGGGGLLGCILTLAVGELKAQRDLTILRANNAVQIINDQAQTRAAMDTILDFWKTQRALLPEEQQWNLSHAEAAANQWALTKQDEVNKARQYLLAHYNKMMVLYDEELLDKKSLLHIPGKHRAQLFLDHVRPLDLANGKVLFGRQQPESKVFRWVQQHYNIKPQQPLCGHTDADQA
jgi:hypothetical protein